MDEKFGFEIKEIDGYDEEVLILYSVYHHESNGVETRYKTMECVKNAYNSCQIETLLQFLSRYYGENHKFNTMYLDEWSDHWDCECCGTVYDEYCNLVAFGETFESYEDGHFGNDLHFDYKEIHRHLKKNGLDIKFLEV